MSGTNKTRQPSVAVPSKGGRVKTPGNVVKVEDASDRCPQTSLAEM